MGIFGAVIHAFQGGGLFMYPILLLLVSGLAIAIERITYLRTADVEARKLWGKLIPLLNAGRIDDAEHVASTSTSAIGRVLGFGITRLKSSSTRGDVEMAIEEGLMELTPLLERRTHYIAVFANVATLLGLLGTIIGLIHGFGALSGVSASEKQDLLSHAVSEAMNCTAFGLVTAVPFMLIHAWLQAKTDELVDRLETASVKFLNSLGLK